MKFEIFGQAVFVLDSCGGNKGNADCRGRRGMVYKNVRPSYRRIGLSQEFCVPTVNDSFFLERVTFAAFFSYFPQFIFSPSLADSDTPKLFKCIDEIGEIVHCSSDQGEAE